MIEFKLADERRIEHLKDWMERHQLTPCSGINVIEADNDFTMWGRHRRGHNLFLIDTKFRIYKWGGMKKGWRRMADGAEIERRDRVKPSKVQSRKRL